ncbi:NAD(P)-dependent oxidoreductase [Allohahella sp. A8]|uniref:NAD(P)-dependent oxidoreductase n=1 Tax=Allohahella sp. A8 TaxID=3141461 RepID=UPI000C097472|nr:2-hydroxy-3-oxopropionate reductase [Hahellaceae bacterium]|tara:strand:+ start:80333 stop:81235 length:903 start_codon:yes stop_codon:yes gene_type:complete
MSTGQHDHVQSAAFLGLGLMGQPMVGRLLTAGYQLRVWNRTRSKARQFEEDGILEDTAQAAIEGAEVLVLMLTDGPAVDQVLRSLDLSRTAENALIIDMSSIAPDMARQHASLVNAAGRRYLDAPVSGGTPGAASGTLSIMVGGREQDFEAAASFLANFGTPRYMGESGCGQIAKLANQAVVGITIGAVSEAMLLAKQAGVDIVALREALLGGFAASRILELHGQRIIDDDFEPGGRSSVQLKDLRSVGDLAGALGLDLPISALVASLYSQMNAEHLQLDHSALYLHLRSLNEHHENEET